jgi:Undecaprenyl-phosphate glucose phosphotransferase
MLKRYHHSVGLVFRATDAFIVGAVWLIAYWLRFNTPFVEITKGLPEFETYAALTPLVIAIWMAVFAYSRVYASRRMLRRTDEVYLILRSHGIAMLLFLSLTYFFSEYKYSRIVMLFYGILSGTLLVFARLILRNTLREMRKRGHNLRTVLCIGEGGALETLIQRLGKFPELGLHVAGIVTCEGSKVKSVAGRPVLGHLNQLEYFVHSHQVDQVLIALPHHQYEELEQILKLLKDETVDIQLVPDIHEYITLGCAIEEFEGIPIVHINDSPLKGWGALTKRLTDILLAGLALAVLSPLLLLIGILIKISSRGPIFYQQERMGMDGKTFLMLKFRSMRQNAELETGAVWARQNDERRTRFGQFLRSSSLDELPQLWNVFRGEMSLVGPRPERPVFVEKFRHDIPHYMLRHKVKAGITGWAQINGWRGNTSLDRRIECDLYYIRNWSYGLDFKIMLLTFWKGFINKNAY